MKKRNPTKLEFLAVLSLAALASSASQSAFAQAKGSMVVSYKDDLATLDPQVGYDWQNWPAIKMLFDALLDYKPGTTVLEPRIAAALPTITDGAKVTPSSCGPTSSSPTGAPWSRTT